MQAYAACDDPEIRVATRAGFKKLWELAERLTGLPFQGVVDFFADRHADERGRGDGPARRRRAVDQLVPEEPPARKFFFNPEVSDYSLPGGKIMTAKSRTAWTFAVTSAALFMASLDNLVVTTALPSIREHLHASLQGLQWTVNAYTLTFAVLLLTGATLGERYGRRRMFVIGLSLFTAGSAAAALAPGIGALVAARAIQGVGAAIVIPLTLTLLSAAVTPATTRPGAGRLGRRRRAGDRHRPAGRRGHRRGRVLAVDLLAERADRHRAAADRLDPAHREPRAVDQPGPARPRAGQRGPARHRARRGPRQRPRLDQPHRAAAHRDRRAAGGRRSSPGNCGPASRCCRCTCSAAAASP